MPPSRPLQQLQPIITLKARPAPREIADQIFLFSKSFDLHRLAFLLEYQAKYVFYLCIHIMLASKGVFFFKGNQSWTKNEHCKIHVFQPHNWLPLATWVRQQQNSLLCSFIFVEEANQLIRQAVLGDHQAKCGNLQWSKNFHWLTTDQSFNLGTFHFLPKSS